MKIDKVLKARYAQGHSEGFSKGTWAGGAEVLDWVEEELKDLEEKRGSRPLDFGDAVAAARKALRQHPAYGYKAEVTP